MRKSIHTAPVVSLATIFIASRAWAWEAGVRFDASTLPWFWQYVDPRLLKAHLFQSVWYLHSQPPLYNLLLGVGLKTFGSTFNTAAHGAQIALGIAMTASLYAGLMAVGVTRWWAVAATTLFIASPTAILYENWLFYEYLVAALLLATVVAFIRFARVRNARWSFAVFALLAALCYVRSTFQILLMLIVLAFMLVVFSEQRRAITVGAVVPLLLVAALSVKQIVLFGTPSTSSWAWMNLMQVDQHAFHAHQAEKLEQEGVIPRISSIRVFLPLDAYAGQVKQSDSYRGIPVLHERTKPSGSPNFNNIEHLAVSQLYMHAFLQILIHEPQIYLRGIWIGLKTSASPSDDYYFVLPNRSKIQRWARAYDLLVLWQPRVHWRFGLPFGTAWGIVAAYIAALVYGGAELLRLALRKRASAVVAFVWLLLGYSALVTTLGEVAENQRLRFPDDPLVTILVAAAAAQLVRRFRASLSKRSTHREVRSEGTRMPASGDAGRGA